MDMNPQDVMLSDTVTGKRKGNRDIPTCQEGKGIKYIPPHAHPSKNRMKQKQYRITFNDKNRKDMNLDRAKIIGKILIDEWSIFL